MPFFRKARGYRGRLIEFETLEAAIEGGRSTALEPEIFEGELKLVGKLQSVMIQKTVDVPTPALVRADGSSTPVDEIVKPRPMLGEDGEDVEEDN